MPSAIGVVSDTRLPARQSALNMPDQDHTVKPMRAECIVTCDLETTRIHILPGPLRAQPASQSVESGGDTCIQRGFEPNRDQWFE